MPNALESRLYPQLKAIMAYSIETWVDGIRRWACQQTWADREMAVAYAKKLLQLYSKTRVVEFPSQAVIWES